MRTLLTILAVCLAFNVIISGKRVNTYETVEDLIAKYGSRTESEWHDVWHTETHQKCRNSLYSYVIFACMVDIYAVGEKKRAELPFLDQGKANDFLENNNMNKRMTRFRRASPTEECCSDTTGCNWEELAEYCSHQRNGPE